MIEQTASLLHQQAMAQFMKEGLWRGHIKKMRKTYKQKMSLFTRVITEVLGEWVTIIGQHSGHYLLMKVHSKHTERWLIKQTKLQGVGVYPTSSYFRRMPSKEPILQLGFANVCDEKIIEGVHLLKRAWFT
ncbi:hypothetical protein [Priestia koreensis]|uniref:hypothetical protein n=1 Tax=Priestia koreensis TaxID=284581 RepID=UPI0034578ABD